MPAKKPDKKLTEYPPMALTEPHGLTAHHPEETKQLGDAQRITRKVANLLARPRVAVADQRRIAHMALLAIAGGPPSTARDIAVTALKVVTSE